MAAEFERQSGCFVSFKYVGGVEAVKRIQGGEFFDLVTLASNVIDQLTATRHILAGSRVDPVRFRVAVAVRTGAALPDISSEGDVRLSVHTMQSVC